MTLTHDSEDEKHAPLESSNAATEIENGLGFALIRIPQTEVALARLGIKGSYAHSLARSRSSNGFGCDGPDIEDAGQGVDERDPFEVRFEGGDDDPLSPRSMARGRKWVVVIIVSISSFCV